MQWHTQAGSITTNLKVKADFTLPELSATKTMTWIWNVVEYAKGRYEIIYLGSKYSDHGIEA